MRNAKFFKDIKFWGVDKVSNFFFKEEFVSVLMVIINYDQASVPNIAQEVTLKPQDNV